MKYSHHFETEEELYDSYNNDYIHPWISFTDSTSAKTYSKSKDEYQKYISKRKYLTLNIISAGTISWVASNSSQTRTINYKLNDGEWIQLTSSLLGTSSTINVTDGDILQFKGSNTYYSSGYMSNSFSGSTAMFELEGNIMSLLYGDNFAQNISISSDYTFAYLFINCTGLVSAKNFILPASSLTRCCYSSMFKGCSSLTMAPELPAQKLSTSCYGNMFAECISLTDAPKLPATTNLIDGCYSNMFMGCTNLIYAPELPSPVVGGNAYSSMFELCTSLINPPDLPAVEYGSWACWKMFKGCTSLINPPEMSAATTVGMNCFQEMFIGCVSLTHCPPVLRPSTLVYACYQEMFKGCIRIKDMPELPATNLANYCYYYMFSGCTSLTGVTSLQATNLQENCYNGMFYGCTSLTVAPDLMAETFVKNSCRCMFKGCSSLRYIKCLATDISASDCTLAWVNGVGSNGTFVKSVSMDSWPSGQSGIPDGWDIQNYG